MEGILSKGITVADAPAFFETPVGQQYVEDHVIAVQVSSETVAWVPAGMLAVPVALESKGRVGSMLNGCLVEWLIG